MNDYDRSDMMPASATFMYHAMKLVEASPHRERIAALLANPEIGTQEYLPHTVSNCFGTVCYVFGMDDHNPHNRPRFVHRHFMEEFLRGNCEAVSYKEAANGIVGFLAESGDGTSHRMVHAGVFLGQTPTKSSVIFHQPDSGKPFRLDGIEDAFPDYCGAHCISFHRVVRPVPLLSGKNYTAKDAAR